MFLYQMNIVTDIVAMKQEMFIPDEYCNRYSSNGTKVFNRDLYCIRYSSNEANVLIPDEY